MKTVAHDHAHAGYCTPRVYTRVLRHVGRMVFMNSKYSIGRVYFFAFASPMYLAICVLCQPPGGHK